MVKWTMAFLIGFVSGLALLYSFVTDFKDTNLLIMSLIGLVITAVLSSSFSKDQEKERLEQNQKSFEIERDDALNELRKWYEEEKANNHTKKHKELLKSRYEVSIEGINDCTINGDIQPIQEVNLSIRIFALEVLPDKIISLLKKEKTKLPASDIDFQLRIGDVDLVKELCEEMYRDKKIGRTGNYRYFV